MVQELKNKQEFDELLKKGPVIVDFWAEWCGPCKMMAPQFEKAATHYSGKLTFAKVNTEENDWAIEEFGIQGIPCLILFKEGKELNRIIGYHDAAGLQAKIDKLLA